MTVSDLGNLRTCDSNTEKLKDYTVVTKQTG